MNPNKKIRRLQSLLYTSGVGTVLFSLWSGVREIGIFFDGLKQLSNMDGWMISAETIKAFYVVFFFLFLFSFSFLYIYIGNKAILTSRAKNRSNAYIVWSVILIIGSFATHVHSLVNFQSAPEIRMEQIILFVIDVTSNIILVEVVVFSVLLKRMRC